MGRHAYTSGTVTFAPSVNWEVLKKFGMNDDGGEIALKEGCSGFDLQEAECEGGPVITAEAKGVEGSHWGFDDFAKALREMSKEGLVEAVDIKIEYGDGDRDGYHYNGKTWSKLLFEEQLVPWADKSEPPPDPKPKPISNRNYLEAPTTNYLQQQRDKIHKVVEQTYEDAGPSAVYDLFPGEARCEACEATTPSILDTCALCGQVRKS